MTLLVILLTLAVGFFNGANDISKAIATLVGSGVGRDRTAILWGSIWTLAGALTAIWAAQGLIAAFSGKGLLADVPQGEVFILAVAVGALVWIWLATRTGLPVSTTHAITGGLVGAGFILAGPANIHWSFLVGKFALPLAVSPFLSLAMVFAVFPLLRFSLKRCEGYCVCVQQSAAMVAQPIAFGASKMTMSASAPMVMVGNTTDCARSPVTVAGIDLVDGLHWLSAGATAFARGLNDAPKVLGLGVVAAAAIGLPLTWAFVLVAVAMTAGSLLKGLRVVETLSRKVTPMEPLEGLAANFVTAILVVFASKLALPVSTTHVSSGAIIGLGLRRDARQVRWKTVRDMLLAWIVTLPVAGLIAAATLFILQKLP
ncbi:MAG: inorganic phosphate transporter [Opitutaceae bacterium]|jgi:PiT family inorganic phosphate transporter